MSTYKTIKQGAKHIRVPDDVADHPVILGHEFCAEVMEVTDKWKDRFQVGQKVRMPPVLSYLGGMQTVGYSFGELGKTDARFLELDRLVKGNNGLWSAGAERYLLENF